LQHAFPLNILMVPSSTLTVTVDGECLLCGGFSLSKTVHFGSIELIFDCFGGLSLSPWRDGLDATFMGSTRSGPPSPLWAMIGDSTEEFHMASSGEGGSDLPPPRRHDAADTSTTQAMMTIPPRPMAPWSDTNLPFERQCAHQRGNKRKPILDHLAPSRRHRNGRTS
jgi:hypothetical protein